MGQMASSEQQADELFQLAQEQAIGHLRLFTNCPEKINSGMTYTANGRYAIFQPEGWSYGTMAFEIKDSKNRYTVGYVIKED